VGCLGRKQAFVRARYQYEVRAGREGYVAAIDTRGMGLAAIDIGAGRRQLGERIEHAAGFEVTRRVGHAVGRADPLVTVHSEHRLEKEFLSRVRQLFKITQNRPGGT
jgi:thymidine phosphorylase